MGGSLRRHDARTPRKATRSFQSTVEVAGVAVTYLLHGSTPWTGANAGLAKGHRCFVRSAGGRDTLSRL